MKLPTITLAEIEKRGKAGDCIGTESRTWWKIFATLIRWISKSPLSHITIVKEVTSKGFNVVESVAGSGVEDTFNYFEEPQNGSILKHLIKKSDTIIYYFELNKPLTKKQEKLLIDESRRLEGRGYPFQGLFRTIKTKFLRFGATTYEEPNFQIQKPHCMEFVSNMLYKIGVLSREQYLKNPHRTPSAMFKFPQFTAYKVLPDKK